MPLSTRQSSPNRLHEGGGGYDGPRCWTSVKEQPGDPAPGSLDSTT